ncbi:hypothetical protein EIP91_010468 [Steccherinum ochraceum]|uniref:BAG domain-containing protein n=1 Tax=Steccherinum ochraceum TaxID=92696 RepID=A0A4R0RNB2_9APHY|nr:hypothetical protein EIP91_010468 [Steccherinum ochraceum]
MFSYRPAYTYSPYDAGYAQALAEERAARAQYAAALQAQEEARNRAARARQLREAYASASPYNSYLSDDCDVSDEEYPPAYYSGSHPFRPTYGYASAHGLSPQQRLALAALEREREQQKLAELEEQRRRQAAVEAERRRQAVEEETRRRLAEFQVRRQDEADERYRRQPTAFEQLFGAWPPREQPQPVRRSGPSPLAVYLGLTPTPSQIPTQSTRTTSPPARRPTPPAAESAPEPVRIPIQDPKPVNEAERAAAAEKIQAAYHAYSTRRKALQSIADIHSRFDSLKSSFTLPHVVDFQGDDSHDSHTTVDTATLVLPTIEEEPPTPVEDEDAQPAFSAPKLAYTSTNAPVHQYDEELNQLLSKLDAVESGGDHTIREKRRELVRMVEKEAQRMDLWRVAVWRAHKEAEAAKESAVVEDQVMEGVPAVDAAPEIEEAPTTTVDVSQPPMVVEPEPSSSIPDSTPLESATTSLSIDTSVPMDTDSSILSQSELEAEVAEDAADALSSTLSSTTASEPTFDSMPATPLKSTVEDADEDAEDDQAVLVALSDSDAETSPEVLAGALPLRAEPQASTCAQEEAMLGRDERILEDFVMC